MSNVVKLEDFKLKASQTFGIAREGEAINIAVPDLKRIAIVTISSQEPALNQVMVEKNPGWIRNTIT